MLGTWREEWLKNFLRIVGGLQLRTEGFLISLVTYSRNSVFLGTSHSPLDGLSNILVTWPATSNTGLRNTKAGLNMCFNEMSGTPGRHVIVLVSTGRETKGNAIPFANKLRKRKIGVVTMGGGDPGTVEFLKRIATNSLSFYTPSSNLLGIPFNQSDPEETTEAELFLYLICNVADTRSCR